MKMTRFEKRFVNRKKKSEGNIKNLENAFRYIDMGRIKTVLEIGCGIGFVSSYLAETCHYDVTGTDYDAEQVQLARTLQPVSEHLHFQVEDATELSFNDSRFDLVISQNVFHHIPSWPDAMREIARVLTSEGYFIWQDLTLPGMIISMFSRLTINYGLYTIDDIRRILDINGFRSLAFEQRQHILLSQYHLVLQAT